MTNRTQTKPPVVAIDGPAGVGKGTTAKGVAKVLGVPALDTGSIYRAAALACQMAGVDLHDDEACGAVVSAAHIVLRDGVAAEVNGVDVSGEIRGVFATAHSSIVSAHPTVRTALLEFQRAQVRLTGGVVEGRDIGTVVLPDALLKVYLTASARRRQERRVLERISAAGGDAEAELLAQVAADLAERDARDSGRLVAPLQAAADAVVVDNSERTLQETIDLIVGLVRERMHT